MLRGRVINHVEVFHYSQDVEWKIATVQHQVKLFWIWLTILSGLILPKLCSRLPRKPEFSSEIKMLIFSANEKVPRRYSPSRAYLSSPLVWCTGRLSAWPDQSCRSTWFPTVVPPSTPGTPFRSGRWKSPHRGWGPPSCHLQNNIITSHAKCKISAILRREGAIDFPSFTLFSWPWNKQIFILKILQQIFDISYQDTLL